MAISQSNAELEAPLEPQGNGSAIDAQKKLVEESKNAGVAAFTFDPDASPEEKKRQAAAVSSYLIALMKLQLVRLTHLLFDLGSSPGSKKRE